MSRIQQIYNMVNEILHSCDGIPAVYTHLFEVSQSCALIALRRGENAELATIAGVLHDIAYLKSNANDANKIIGLTGNNHAEISSKIAMEILKELNITTSEENDIVFSAILKHSDKETINTPFDEVLKDADVLAHGLSDVTGNDFRGVRWDNICKEFDIINLADRYAKAKYGDEYIHIEEFSRYGAAIDIHKVKKQRGCGDV